MKHYIGLDVSMQETAICVLNEEGRIVYEGMKPTDPESLANHINTLNIDVKVVGVESGSISNWLVKSLQERDIPVVCVDARQMSAILSVKNNKNDKNDARGIAKAMKAEMYTVVHLKSSKDVEVGTLLSSRRILIGIRTKLKNSVRGLLKGYGIRLKTTARVSFSELVEKTITELSDSTKLAIRSVLASYHAIDEQIKGIDECLLKYAAESEDVKLLMTVPGVGKITALCFVAAIGDPKRFKNSRDVGTYVGMTPRL